jgi:hypothetical protein
VSDCHRQAKNTRAKLKDMVTEANDNGTAYELEIAIARVHKRHPELFDDPTLEEEEEEREDRIAKELKTRENRRTAARSYHKSGGQIRDHVKPNSIKKFFLTSLEVPGEVELLHRIEGMDAAEDHLIERNVEQFSHAGKTPFGYTALGK